VATYPLRMISVAMVFTICSVLVGQPNRMRAKAG